MPASRPTLAQPAPPTVAAELGVPLSVLDLASVAEGATHREALLRTEAVAKQAEALGYHRLWVAEHHNMPAVASSAPDVLVAHLGAVTDRIRLGSGGVMLPNHAPLVVAERFAMLEHLHPGRIDLGIGRAPGTDQRTAQALRRAADTIHGDAFLQQLAELEAFALDTVPADHPYAGIHAVPGGVLPPMWLLGSSGFSAQVAALTSRPFSFAYHFAPQGLEEALHLYRSRFVASDELPDPYVMLGVNVICAPTDDEAQYLAGSGRLMRRWLRTGDLRPVASPATAREALGPPDPGRPTTAMVGSPETVVAGLADLLERTGVQELMLSGVFFDGDDQTRSLELVAKAAGLT
jgi:luciferase family oxidoreductase group 1